jgi:hypothetical protein
MAYIQMDVLARRTIGSNEFEKTTLRAVPHCARS